MDMESADAQRLERLLQTLDDLPGRLSRALSREPAAAERDDRGRFTGAGGGANALENLGFAAGRFVPAFGQLAGFSRDARGLFDAWDKFQDGLKPARPAEGAPAARAAWPGGMTLSAPIPPATLGPWPQPAAQAPTPSAWPGGLNLSGPQSVAETQVQRTTIFGGGSVSVPVPMAPGAMGLGEVVAVLKEGMVILKEIREKLDELAKDDAPDPTDEAERERPAAAARPQPLAQENAEPAGLGVERLLRELLSGRKQPENGYRPPDKVPSISELLDVGKAAAQFLP